MVHQQLNKLIKLEIRYNICTWLKLGVGTVTCYSAHSRYLIRVWFGKLSTRFDQIEYNVIYFNYLEIQN